MRRKASIVNACQQKQDMKHLSKKRLATLELTDTNVEKNV
jgi:hypothetical protein